MRLLFVSHRRDVSGGEICTQRILEHLREHSLLVVLPEGAFSRQLVQARIPVHVENALTSMSRAADPYAFFKMAARLPGLVTRLVQKFREFKPDLVISNGLGPLLYAGPASRLAGVPNVCIHYHPVLRAGSADARLVFGLSKFCDGFVAVSDAMNRGLQVSGIAPERVATIYNGLDIDFYSPSPERSNLLRSNFNLQPEVKLIGLVGTISENKGHHVVIEAARLLRDEFKAGVPWKIVFIGEIFENNPLAIAYQARLQEQIKAAHLEDHVIFAGRHKDMRGVYADLDIVLNTSVEPEPLGTTIYEAMAMGKVVVANTLGGSPEIIGESGKSGFLVPPGDSQALASTLESILSGKVDVDAVLRSARARVEQLFDLKQTVTRYVAYFEAQGKTN